MLRISGLRKAFDGGGHRVLAINNIDLSVRQGTFLTMLGPSGCGKTTTVRCIAGLDRPDAGQIDINGRVMVDAARRIYVPANGRGLGMVFQSYAIWPHMSAFENVAFPLRVMRGQRMREVEIHTAVMRALEMVRLSGQAARHATQLSGGQQQRLALARAIVRTPQLLLLDEPLSNLDARLRDDMRLELKRLQTSLGVTTIYVTHDQEEALSMSDEVVLFEAGRIVQRGTPAELYHRPATRFAASFVGAANFLSGVVQHAAGDALLVRTSHGDIRCTGMEALPNGTGVTLSIRPERIQLGTGPDASAANGLQATIAACSFLGNAQEYVLALGDDTLRVRTSDQTALEPGQQVVASFDTADCLVLTA